MCDGGHERGKTPRVSSAPGEPDEEEARRARARRLREDIEWLKSGGRPAIEEPRRPETPRDFVERRMRELDAGEQDKSREEFEPD